MSPVKMFHVANTACTGLMSGELDRGEVGSKFVDTFHNTNNALAKYRYVLAIHEQPKRALGREKPHQRVEKPNRLVRKISMRGNLTLDPFRTQLARAVQMI
jgi:hypothetical protein